MPAVRIDRCLLVTLQMQWQGQIVENVLAYKYADSDPRPSGPDLVTFSQFVWTAVQSAYRSITTSQIRYVQVTTRDISPSNVVEGAYSVPGVIVGGLATESLPNQVAAVISLHTAAIGASGRGRIYIPGLATNAMQTGVMTATTLTLVTAIGTAWFNVSGLATLHTSLCVASRVRGVVRFVQSYSVDNILDTQRRRVIGRGH